MISPIDDDINNKIYCKYCLESEPMDDLFTPCKCKGYSAFVHRKCLSKWFDFNNQENQQCEICHHEYIYKTTDNSLLFSKLLTRLRNHDINNFTYKHALLITCIAYTFNLILSNFMVIVARTFHFNPIFCNITNYMSIYYPLEDTNNINDEYLGSYILTSNLFAYMSILYMICSLTTPVCITVPVIFKKITTFNNLWYLSIYSTCEKNGFNIISITFVTILFCLFSIWPMTTFLGLVCLYHTRKNNIISTKSISDFASKYINKQEVKPIENSVSNYNSVVEVEVNAVV